MLVIFVADSARNSGNCASKMEIQWAWNAHLDWSVGMQTNSFFIAWLTIVQPQASSESISVMWLTSSSMTSTWPYREAICNEFHPVLCRKAGLAPFMIRHLTACTFPFSAASISGVLPVAVLGSISVMWLTSSWMTTTSPHSEAQCNEFLPLLSRRPRSAPLLSLSCWSVTWQIVTRKMPGVGRC